MESYLGGFSSSALATRKGLTKVLVQAYGVYLTDRRLLVTKETSSLGYAWSMNPNAILGSFISEVEPFLNKGELTISELDKWKKELDVELTQVSSVELKAPSFLFKGHIRINLKSGQSFKLLVLDTSVPCGHDAFEAAKDLCLKHLPAISRIV